MAKKNETKEVELERGIPVRFKNDVDAAFTELKQVERSTGETIASAQLEALTLRVEKSIKLGKKFETPTAKALMQAAGIDRVGNQLHEAFKDKTSGMYYTPKEREEVPSASILSRCFDLCDLHTPARFTEFTASGNGYKLEDYVTGLKIMAGIPLGNRSTILAAESKGEDGKLKKFKRPAPTPKGTPTVTSTEFGVIESKTRAELEAIVANPVYNLAKVPVPTLQRLHDQVAAMLILARPAVEELPELEEVK